MDVAKSGLREVVLGISAYHPDSAACIVRDGTLVAAAEEERFTRVKHWAGLPALAAADCLRTAGIEWADIDVVAVNSVGMQWSYRKFAHLIRHRPSIRLLREKVTTRSARMDISKDLAGRFGSTHIPRVVHVEHHDAHLASAYLTSGWTEATLASVDGFGDFSSTAFARASGGKSTTFHRVRFPHSLGAYYQAMTHYLGFRANGDEYKVMGLAAHGEPRFRAELSNLVRSTGLGFELDLGYFRHHTDSLSFTSESGEPSFDPLYSRRLVDLLGSPRVPNDVVDDRIRDLAASVQAVFEDVLFASLNQLAAVAPSRRLGLAGGCALNAVAVGKIRERTPFAEVWVPPGAGDAGGAVGAALTAAGATSSSMTSAFLGPSFAAEAPMCVAQNRPELDRLGIVVSTFHDDELLLALVADQLVAGAVVGWYQGRMEWGPRALGNRSILCDPRRLDARDLLNSRVKHRETFRPFGPSILAEAIHDWVVGDAGPFMTSALPVVASRRDEVPAVVHVDGTTRPQSVDRVSNPRYHRLIQLFGAKTGVPMLLNTSFNEREPIVCTPEEAIACFLRTEMDLLVLDDHLLQRRTH